MNDLPNHPRRRLTSVASCIVLGWALSGCTLTRVDPPAPASPSAAFKEQGLWVQAGQHADAESAPDAWWQQFNDPVLNELQARLVVGNENLRAALAQVDAARAALGTSRAAQAPSVTATLEGDRSRSVATGSAPSTLKNSVALSGTATWELDLWGRLVHATEAAQARYQASADDLAAVRLSAQATLTQTYLALRAAEAQQALYERTVAVYQRSLELTQARYQAGVAPQTDVLQAQTQLKTAQVQSLDTAAQRTQLEHAIAVLLGQPPSGLSLERTAALPTPPAVPRFVPATLLERRPDIAAAERRVAAAYAQIGVARAGYFPDLTLSATGGYRGSGLSQLLTAPHLFWSVGPALAQKIFDGGATRAACEQAQANADQASATYRQTVLTALQEVEDNLVLADQLSREAALQREALQAAQRNLEITQNQYRVGTVGYLNVVTAQAAALTSERSLLDVQARQLNAVNQLLKNLAGRWERAAE
ncbi:efflux transporter outer membrane subunit [Aquabacterium sp.]|uniref:efflux transporter outer membrane subunit n=1 Tax=Aquabacterium sp. TaxID=1872578 RepID=UPI0035AE67EC